jgi:hypothetical protein
MDTTRMAAIMPAPGFKVFSCFIFENTEAVVLFEELPVIGWVICRTNDELPGDDIVQLLIFHEEGFVVRIHEDVSENEFRRIFRPGEELTTGIRAQMELSARRKLANINQQKRKRQAA